MTASRSGQSMIFFALLLPLALLPAAAFGTEAAFVAARQARLQEAAVVAALDAAQALDVARLRAGGEVGVDPGAAAAAVRGELGAYAPQASLDAVSTAGSEVRVLVSERVPLRFATFVPGAAVTVRASAAARLRGGFSAPS